MKFLYSLLKNNETTVALANKYGTYKGKAKLNPEDEANRFTGYKIAEWRAWIDFFEKDLKKKKNMLYAMKNLNQDIHKNCSEISPGIQRRINLKIRDYNRDIEEARYNIQKLQKNIKEETSLRKKIRERSKKDK